MNPDGARAAVAHFVMAHVAATVAEMAARPQTDAPYTWDVKPKYVRPTMQQALDAVCARAKENAR